jgi:O-antigen/teichoic acid export membrane protein
VTTAREETRKFGLAALTYLIPNVLVRGITFLLTPLYTRVMSPEDFAIVGVANTLTSALGLALGLALYGCIPRLFAHYATEEERRRFYGTLLVFSLTVPTVIAAGLHLLGAAGGLNVFTTVRFDPHLVIVIWTAFFNTFLPLPMGIYMAREEPRKVGYLNIAAGLLQLALTLVFVVGLRQGALGVLRAGLWSGVAMGLVSIGLMVRLSKLTIDGAMLKRALGFSLPLVPHLLANWALSVSDRIILERNVPQGDLGRYSLAFMYGMVVSLIASAATTPIAPAANRQLADPVLAKNVPPLGTHALMAVTFVATMMVATARETIAIVAPRAYSEAEAAIPWLVLGSVLQGVYLIWSTGTWYSMKTKAVPLVTLTSAAVNVGLNLLFVPRYGVMAAAVMSAVGYGVSSLLHGALAQKLHPIPWEYSRWARLLGAGVLTCVVTRLLRLESVAVGLALKVPLALVLFLGTLVLTGFFPRGTLLALAKRFTKSR